MEVIVEIIDGKPHIIQKPTGVRLTVRQKRKSLTRKFTSEVTYPEELDVSPGPSKNNS